MKTKQKPHKLLSLLLCCVMLVGMMPMTAAPAYAGGVTVTNMNSGSGDGWSYDSGTLNLTNYNGTAPVSTDATTIVLNGTNTINFSAPNESDHTGLSLIASSEVTIKGNGSLTITVGGDSTNVNAGVHGINAQNKLSVDESASITITAYNKNAVYGIYAKEFANNSSGELKINVTTTDAHDIRGIELFNSGGSATFANGTTEITVSGNKPNTAYGIYSAPNSSGNIMISGGKLKITMPNKGSGILMSKNGKIYISGGETTITGADNGIFNGTATGVTDINITGGKLSITSEVSSSRGVYSNNNGVTISNATVEINTKGNCILCGGSVNISGNSVVNVTATDDYTPAMKGGNDQTHNFNLASGGEITATGAHWYTIQSKITLGANTIAGEGTTKSSDSDNYYGTQESKPYTVKFVYQAPVVHPAKPSIDVTGTYTYTDSDITATVTGYDVETMNITGNTGKNAGNYTVSVTSKTGQWADGTTDAVTKAWSIDKKTPTADDFTFTEPSNLTYDGNNKTVSIALKSLMAGIGTITPKYYKGDALVTETKDAGEYTVKFDITEGGNFNSATGLTATEWKFTITPADQTVPTGLGVQAPTTEGSKGKITGTTANMEYNTSADATSGWNNCTDDNTEVTPGTYYVRYKADANHNASHASAALTVPNYTAETYEINVTDGTALPSGNQHAGTTITITANTPASGMIFDKWVVKSGTITLTNENSASTTFIMPASTVKIKATYKGAALTGTVTISGTEKFGEILTASVSGSNNTGTLTYKWYRDGAEIAMGSSHITTADDIGKTLTCKVTSDVQTGTIEKNTANIDKADGPAAPTGLTGVACTTSANNDGKITGTTDKMEYSNSAEFTSKTTCTGTEITGLTNGTYYVRVAETATYKAGAYIAVTVAAYTAPPAPPAGGGLIPAVQEPDITIIGSGKATLSTDGSTADITADEGYELASITLNGKEIANTDKLTGLKTGDKVVVTFQKKSEEPTVDTKTIVDKVGKMKLTARSAKTTKKNIKITVNTDKETNNLIKEIKDLGYTVKYKYYRSTKKASKYTAKVEKDADINSYINTSGKKGTKYYYKVRVMVYDADGNLIAKSDLKQCKYASRTWSK